MANIYALNGEFVRPYFSKIPPRLPLLKGGKAIPLFCKGGATCLREAPPAKASCGGQALWRRQGGDLQTEVRF